MALTKVSYSMITNTTLNVVDFGAVGDGITDDSAAFQAAITYAQSLSTPSVIFLGSRIYKLTTNFTVNPDRVQFCGTSATMDFSTLASGSAILWQGVATAGEVILGNFARCHLYGIKLLGNSSITLCNVKSTTGTRDSRELSFEHVVFKDAGIGINLGNNGWKLQVRNFGFQACVIGINEESSVTATNFGENNNFTSGLFSGGAGTIAFKSQNFSSDNQFHMCSFDTAVAVNISNGARAFLVGCHIETQDDEIVFSVEGDSTGLAQTFLSLKDCLLVLFDRYLSIFNCGTVYSVGNGGIDIDTLAIQGESTVLTPNSLVNGSGKTKVRSLACQFRFPAITVSPFLNSTAYGGFEAANFAATDFEAVDPANPPVIDTVVKRTGTSSLKMANVLGATVGATLTKPVKPGQNVFLSLFYKLAAVAVGANAFNSFNIFAKVYDATGAVIATVNEEAYFTGTVDWTYYTSVVLRQTTMPAGAETIVITVAINAAASGTAYVDDFVLNIID